MIKNDKSVYIIAEIGGNHEGNFEYAVSLCLDAISSGVNAVKFQVYTGETLVNKKLDPARVKHFNKFSLDSTQYLQLASICHENNVDFIASVWTESDIELYEPRMPFFKVGSGDLTAYPILKRIAKTKKPILLSTGLASIEEVQNTVDYIQQLDSIYSAKNMLGILQCTAMYPIPDQDANLSAITKYKSLFPYAVIGYSDHTLGTYAAEIAVALGSEILELHFTDQKENRSFRDHQVSFTSADIKELKRKIQLITNLLGDGEKRVMPSELKSGHNISFRRGIYPRRAIKKGEIIKSSDLIALRPVGGTPANLLHLIEGKKSPRNYDYLDDINIDDFEQDPLNNYPV